MEALGVYIHIPVCNQKCDYCDFYSIPYSDVNDEFPSPYAPFGNIKYQSKIESLSITQSDTQNTNHGNVPDNDENSIPDNKLDTEKWLNFWNEYANKLELDLLYKANQLSRKVFLYSIFFGGGTPSLVPPKILGRIINSIKKIFPRYKSRVETNSEINSRNNLEITLEVNPEDVSKQFLDEIVDAGINRVSMGLQSLNNKDLEYLGRTAGLEMNLKALDTLSKSKITNTSVDIIYGIVGQKWENIENTLSAAIRSRVKHISAYSLTVERGTTLSKAINRREKKNLSESRQFFHYQAIQKYLEDRKYFQYEVSNYALDTFACKHNMLTWKFRPYIGIGPAAHSFIHGKRISNTANLDLYSHLNIRDIIKTEKSDAATELMIGAFRIGVFQAYRHFQNRLNEQQYNIFYKTLEGFSRRGWIKRNNTGFVVTKQGLLFSDLLLQEMVVQIQ